MNSNGGNIQHNTRHIHYKPLSHLDTYIAYHEIYADDKANTPESHVHAECEIYINLTGDVSFMVENRIYPIISGNIVITRPYEYHHCIYHSNDLHKHFHILFSSHGNEHLFKRFFDRGLGEQNLLKLSAGRETELIALCHSMINKPSDEAEQYFRFFKLIHLLDTADVMETATVKFSDFQFALNYINQNFALPMTIQDIAQAAHVSLNTLERHFYEAMRVSPSAYLKKKRLANAAELLHKGSSVIDACQNSGFSDCSSFIALFKKNYGITPLKYKKQFENTET